MHDVIDSVVAVQGAQKRGQVLLRRGGDDHHRGVLLGDTADKLTGAWKRGDQRVKVAEVPGMTGANGAVGIPEQRREELVPAHADQVADCGSWNDMTGFSEGQPPGMSVEVGRIEQGPSRSKRMAFVTGLPPADGPG